MATADVQQRPIRVGVFTHLENADRAVEQLLMAGFHRDHLMVVCSDQYVRNHFRNIPQEKPAGSNTPKAVAVGGSIGAGLGGLAELAVGAATGGIGLLAAGGLALWTGGVLGGLVGAMMTRGVEKEVANFYDQALQKHQILVAAEAQEPDLEASLVRAEQIFAEAGAEPLPMREG